MDVFLARMTGQAMNFAIRSGISITATYAVKQCGENPPAIMPLCNPWKVDIAAATSDLHHIACMLADVILLGR